MGFMPGFGKALRAELDGFLGGVTETRQELTEKRIRRDERERAVEKELFSKAANLLGALFSPRSPRSPRSPKGSPRASPQTEEDQPPPSQPAAGSETDQQPPAAESAASPKEDSIEPGGPPGQPAFISDAVSVTSAATAFEASAAQARQLLEERCWEGIRTALGNDAVDLSTAQLAEAFTDEDGKLKITKGAQEKLGLKLDKAQVAALEARLSHLEGVKDSLSAVAAAVQAGDEEAVAEAKMNAMAVLRPLSPSQWGPEAGEIEAELERAAHIPTAEELEAMRSPAPTLGSPRGFHKMKK